jgi:hypothetical protein
VTQFLTPVAMDFLWESLSAGELPYPLDVPSHGTTMDERSELRHRVLADLRAQDVLDGAGRVTPYVEDWLTLLARGTHSIDCVFKGTSALAVGDGRQALLATQNDEGLLLRKIDPGALASSIVALLPPCGRGTEQSITVPASELDALAAGRPAGRSTTDRQVLKALSQQEKRQAGQLAVNARNPMGGRKRSPVLSWFDTESGRYLTYNNRGRDGTDWITIAPADAPTLRARLGELLTTLSTSTNRH